jgi:alpha-tubulin suppressor-like RCC1 family protein
MITSIQNRATTGKLLALAVLLATILAMQLSTAPAGAAVTSGQAFAWGSDDEGQLGDGAAGPDTNLPGGVSNLSGVKSVKAGCSHGLALKENGRVWAWGLGNYGRLGSGNSDSQVVPVRVKIDNVKAISAGCDHNLALKQDGTVWAWGNNLYGQLGNGMSGEGVYSSVPVQVASLGTGARGVAAGNGFSLALMKDGTVRSWGMNSAGSLGDTTNTSRSTPVPVYNLSNVRAISTDSSGFHSLALLNDGTVRAWGLNGTGQLGDTTKLTRTVPVEVYGLSDVKAIATGEYHSMALRSNGKVSAWGQNTYGQLGNGTSGEGTDRTIAANVYGLDNVRSVSGGAYHSLAVLESGRVRSWGWSFHGELGNGITGSHSDIPVAVKNLTNVRNVDGGDHFTLAATQ